MRVKLETYAAKKVSIATWRIDQKRLPTRVNLDKIGVDLHSIRSPLCDDVLETKSHLFLNCKIAAELWNPILNWVDWICNPNSACSNSL